MYSLPLWNATGPTDVLASTVGGGLPPMGVCQTQLPWLNHCNRGASPLPHWNATGLTDVLAPTMECHWPYGCTRFNCGRGLAPDGGVPDTAVLAEPLQSGASPLPHWNVTGSTDVLASTVGGGLPPMGGCQTQLSWLTPCNRGQPPLTLELCLFLENGYAPTY